MKRIAIIIAVILGISMLHSCEKDDKEPVLKMDDADGPVMTNPDSGESYTLTEEEEENELFAFEWSAADYKEGGLPETRYLLQAVFTELGWEDEDNIRDVESTSSTSHSMTVSQMNQLLTQMGVEPEDTEDVSFRVISFLTRASEHTWLYSEPIDLTFTTYEQVTDPDILNVPGSYQGWDPENDQTVVYSPEQDDLFEGYVYLDEDETEYKYAMGSWDDNWGDDDADGTLQPDGDNIVVEEAGVYKLNVDMEEMTHENLLTEWAVIGDAVEDWDTDVPMELDIEYWEENWKVRYTLTAELEAGEFKFRANEEWDPPAGLNYGIDEDAEEGVLMQGGFGNDIPVDSPGEYTIILDLSGPIYTYELIQ